MSKNTASAMSLGPSGGIGPRIRTKMGAATPLFVSWKKIDVTLAGGKSEHLVLSRPFSRRIHEASNSHSAWQSAFGADRASALGLNMIGQENLPPPPRWPLVPRDVKGEVTLREALASLRLHDLDDQLTRPDLDAHNESADEVSIINRRRQFDALADSLDDQRLDVGC